MKTMILTVLLSFFVGVGQVHGQVTKEYIYDRITRYSALYGVSEGLMTHIVTKESQFNSLAVGDTHLTDPKGNRHISRGLVQINEYFNKDVTPEQAFDVDFSLDFLARKLSEGKCRLWSTCPLSNK